MCEPASPAQREDLLDRLRRAELRRVRARARAWPSTSAPTTTRRSSPPASLLDLLPEVAGLARRAVRRRLDPADLPALALRARARHGGARRRRRRRAARRLPDLRRPRRVARLYRLPRGAPRARARAARRPAAGLDRQLQPRLQAQAVPARRARPTGRPPPAWLGSFTPAEQAALLARAAAERPVRRAPRRCYDDPSRARPLDAAALPLREDLPRRRHPREGRPREHARLARGARAVPRPHAGRVPRARAAALQAARPDGKVLLKRAVADCCRPGSPSARRRASASRSPPGWRPACASRCSTCSRRRGCAGRGSSTPREVDRLVARAPRGHARPPQAALDAAHVPALARRLRGRAHDARRPVARGGRRVKKLNLGSGAFPKEGYVNVDLVRRGRRGRDPRPERASRTRSPTTSSTSSRPRTAWSTCPSRSR